jgi:hypothetical protein
VLDELAAQWSREAPKAADISARLAWFHATADEFWDFRAGRERNQATKAELTSLQVSVVQRAASDLGLAAASAPSYGEYSSILVLGGLLRGCLTRTRTAKELLDSGTSAGTVVGLGGTRFLNDQEREHGAALCINANTEFEAMRQSLMLTFAPTGPPREQVHDDPVPNASWKMTKYENEPPLIVLAAPSLEPSTRRANTADTLIWWRRHGLTDVERHSRFLLVTHQIYVPYQAATAVRTFGLPNDAGVELVGVSRSAGDLGSLTQLFEPQNYLQEIGSAVRGYHALWEALRGPDNAE